MSNRRDFLRKTFIGAAAIAVPGAITNEAFASDLVNRSVFKSLPVSCLSYSFNGLVREGMMDIFHYFETCRYRFNIDAADLWNGMIARPDDDAYIEKVYRALQERQLVVPNIACDGGQLISAPNRDSPEDRAKLRSIQDRYMEICKKWGVGFIRFDANLPGGDVTNNIRDPWPAADFDYLVKRYKELAQKAYDWGFKVGPENHMAHEKYWPNMEKLIKAVDHPGFGICVHFGGWTPNSPETARQDNDAADKASAKWICHTHITWEYTEDPDRLLEKMTLLRDAGYKGYYNAECHAGQNEYIITGIMIEKIRAILNNWNNGGTGQLFPPRQQPR